LRGAWQQSQANAKPSNWASQSAKTVADARFEHQNGSFLAMIEGQELSGSDFHNTALDRIASYAVLRLL
jgi:hypothetical protein